MTINNEHERIKNSIQESDTIEFNLDIADKNHPEIKWSIYGLPKTNEITVMVKANNLVYYIAAKSVLYYPHMSNRMFGLDGLDQKLAGELSDELWRENKTALLAELKHSD